MDPNFSARHRRTVGLVWGALLGGLMTLLGRAALPSGGHNYLLGVACLLGMTLGTIVGVACLILLIIEVVLSRKRAG